MKAYERQSLRWIMVAAASGGILFGGSGCAENSGPRGQSHPTEFVEVMGEPMPDTRQPIALSSTAGKEHRAVMLQHLETVQAIVAALAEEDFDRAKGLTEAHMGFFMHRHPISPAQPQARQDAPFPGATRQPEHFPPAYHDLALAHHEAADDLAKVMLARDLKLILPKLNNVMKACVACHLEYKVKEGKG